MSVDVYFSPISAAILTASSWWLLPRCFLVVFSPTFVTWFWSPEATWANNHHVNLVDNKLKKAFQSHFHAGRPIDCRFIHQPQRHCRHFSPCKTQYKFFRKVRGVTKVRHFESLVEVFHQKYGWQTDCTRVYEALRAYVPALRRKPHFYVAKQVCQEGPIKILRVSSDTGTPRRMCVTSNFLAYFIPDKSDVPGSVDFYVELQKGSRIGRRSKKSLQPPWWGCAMNSPQSSIDTR